MARVTDESDPTRQIVVSLDLEIGEPATGRTIRTDAVLLRPSSAVSGTAYSRPRTLFAARAEKDGTFFDASTLPSLQPGAHTIIVRATTDTGRSVTVAGGFELDDAGLVVSIAAPRPIVDAQPDDPRVLRAVEVGVPPHDPRADPYATAIVGVVVAVAAGMVGTGAAAPRSAGLHARRRGARSLDREAVLSGRSAATLTMLTVLDRGAGDRSGTWRWPYTERTDAFTRWLPSLGSSRTSVLPRLAGDGAWARVMFGSLGYASWLVSATLGLTAVQSHVPAPPLPVLLGLVAVGILDASAGAVGWVVLVATSVLSGSVGTADDLRLLIGLGLLMMTMPLIANLARPLSRPRPLATGSARLERAIDYVVAPVMVALLASGAATALNGFSGLELLAPTDVVAVLWTAAIATVLRYGLQDVSAALYPARTQELAPTAFARPPRARTLASTALAFVVVLFAAEPFFGLSTPTVMVAALSVLPVLLFLWRDYLPDSAALHRWLPRGMLRALIAIVVSAAIAKAVLGDTGYGAVPPIMVLMVLPGIAFAIISAFGRSGWSWPDTALRRLGGALTWVSLVVVMAGAVLLIS